MPMNQASAAVLERDANAVTDVERLRWWIDGPLQALLPHRALLLGQSVRHACGYAAVCRWSHGMPPSYEAAISCAGGNVRSPMLQRLLANGGPVRFDIRERSSADVDPAWRKQFMKAGWSSLVGLARQSTAPPDCLLTTVAFYDVPSLSRSELEALQAVLMPCFERICLQVPAELLRPRELPRSAATSLTPAESSVVALMALGKLNQEISEQLGKSVETVKKQIQSAMRRVGARNRTELARALSRM